MIEHPIYFDHNATTPIDERVMAKYVHFLEKDYANPASIQHASGQFARHNLEAARHLIAEWIGADHREIIFTSGATESNHLAIRGLIDFELEQGKSLKDLHVITSPLEHPAILKPLEKLAAQGLHVTHLSPNKSGMIDATNLETHITEGTCLISLQWANHEIGTIQPIAEFSRIAHDRGIPFHTDATQALGKCLIKVNDDEGKPLADMLTGSSHKFYGPRGTGFLYVRRQNPRIRLSPQVIGGGQERGMRAGTVNVPAIMAMAEAGRLAEEEFHERYTSQRELQSILEDMLEKWPYTRLLGPENKNNKLPNTTCVLFEGVQAQSLMHALPDFAFSSGAACSSPDFTPSQALEAIGITGDELSSAIRISLGKDNTPSQIHEFIKQLPAVQGALRHLNLSGITFTPQQIEEYSPKSWRQWFNYLINFINAHYRDGDQTNLQSTPLPIQADVGSRDCGDWLSISIDKVNPQNVHLQAFGSPITLAVGAYLASFLAYGVNVTEILSSERIATSLSLPPENLNFARLGEKLLTRLAENAENRTGSVAACEDLGA